MYLTKLEFDLSNAGVRSALRDSQKMHTLVTGCFGVRRKDADILFCSRVRGAVLDLYVYSDRPVISERLMKGMNLAAQKDVTMWLDSMKDGQIFGFRLSTMPFRKVAEPGVRNSRRRALRTQEERLAWLKGKAEKGGFDILSVTETPGEKLTARHRDDAIGGLTMDSWIYTGSLRITDVESFRKIVREGVGPGKAYGLGMMLLY